MTNYASSSDNFLGHPKGVYVCFFTEMWERFSFYGMKALLLLYLIQHHKFGDSIGLDILGAYGGLVYCIPVFGGMLADRYLGMRKAVIFGGVLLCLGHFGMAFEGHAATIDSMGNVHRDEGALLTFYFSLSLIIMGVGFLKPNISTIVGKLYAQDDPRRDSGFSLFYAGINLGALFASIVCGYLGQTISWSWGFGAAGIGMFLGLLQFLWGQKYLHGHAEPPKPLTRSTEFTIYLGGLIALIPIAWLMQSVSTIKVNQYAVTSIYFMVLAILIAMLWSAWYAINIKDGHPRQSIKSMWPSIVVFTLVGIVFAYNSQRFGIIDYFRVNSTLALCLMASVLLIFGIWYVSFIVRMCSGVEGQKMSSLMTLIFMCLVFFVLYEQTYGSWVTFTDRLMTKDIAPSLVHTQIPITWSSNWMSNISQFVNSAPWSIVSLLLAPLSFVVASWLSDKNPQSKLPKQLFAGSFLLMLVFLVRDSVVLPQTGGSLTYLGAFFLVLLAPIFSAIWAWLERRKANPSKPIKSSFGLIIAGLSFIPMALAAQQAGATGLQASVWWLVISYFILEVGEMCISPVGLSAVTQLSVPRVMSLMMGTWFLATAFSETLAALFGKLAAIDIVYGGTLAEHSMEWTAAAAKYEHLFWLMMWIGLTFGVLALLFSPLIKRGMHGVK